MIGIRREDKNEWERRAPLTPDHVATLVAERGVPLMVEPSPRRVFPDVDYERAGAALGEGLEGCAVVLGVKEIPVERLRAGTTYLFFSHTMKGQPENMALLRRLLDLRCTLIDFEAIRDGHGRRLIFFGRHAGYAGMIDTLWALGRRLEAEGHVTPFIDVRQAHDYSSLDEATNHLSRIGERLRHTGLSPELHPFVVGVTGSGNVALGAQEILDRLPTVTVEPDELAGLAGDPDRPRNVLYRVAFDRRRRADLARWLPGLHVLIHGAFWTPDQPRLVTVDDLRALWRDGATPRLRVIADISCDIRGGIEATLRPTTPGAPVFLFDVDRGDERDALTGRGPTILAVDNLPCELPAESSEHFGDTLVRFVPALERCDWRRPLEALDLPDEVRAAIVAHGGRLAPRHAHLAALLADADG